MLKMAVLLSGSGRTLDNFHERYTNGSLNAEVQVVVSNVADALGLSKAENYGYPAFHAQGNTAINAILADYEVDVIVLAGFLKLYTAAPELARSVINIHPSLIPSFCGDGFYGSRVHSAVKKRGCLISGCTVHFANEVYDEGPIILQKSVELDYNDTAHDIGDKVFAAECEAFPEALNRVDAKGIDFFWDRVEA